MKPLLNRNAIRDLMAAHSPARLAPDGTIERKALAPKPSWFAALARQPEYEAFQTWLLATVERHAKRDGYQGSLRGDSFAGLKATGAPRKCARKAGTK